MIVQVRLGVIVLVQSPHDKEAARSAVVFQKQTSALEHLKAQSWRGAVQSDNVYGPAQSFFQDCADLERVGKDGLWRQPFPEQHGHIYIAQSVSLILGYGAEQVDGH